MGLGFLGSGVKGSVGLTGFMGVGFDVYRASRLWVQGSGSMGLRVHRLRV